jgi:uncharacterized protein YggU (UPF0235/DUF167 family)
MRGLVILMIIKVKARPNSNEQTVEEKEGVLHVSLKEFSERNKANIELINLLAKYFNTSVTNIRILRGKTSRNKILEIKDK